MPRLVFLLTAQVDEGAERLEVPLATLCPHAGIALEGAHPASEQATEQGSWPLNMWSCLHTCKQYIYIYTKYI